jgi:hypothetical protein
MLRRLISWCVPESALRLQTKPYAEPTTNPTTGDPNITSVETVLKPYKEELEVGGYHAASIYTANQ